MFSGERWIWLVAVMVVPVVANFTEPYPVNVVIMLETENTDLHIDYRQFIPVVNTSLLDVQTYYKRTINFTFISENTSCDGEGTAALAAKLHCDHKIGVFIGPACSRALDALLPLAKSWDIAVVTPVGSGISDPSLYQMVTKLSPYSVWSYAQALVAMFVKYKWTNIAIIFDDSSTESVKFKDGLFTLMGRYAFDKQTYPFTGSSYTSQKLTSVLMDASNDARVFILACQGNESRALLLEAYRLGFATSGDYVFFLIDDLSKVPSTSYWKMGQPDDAVVLRAMGQAIWPYVEVTANATEIFKQVMIYFASFYESNAYNGTEPSMYLIGYYEAFWLYAEALNETLANGGDPLSGIALTTRLWNKTVAGVNGPIPINDQGYRQNNVTFGSFDISTGRLEAGAFYDYEMGILGDISNDGFDWPYSHGVPPPNEPKCGYKNNRCWNNASLSNTVIGGMAGLFGLIVVAGFIGAILMYRSWKSKHYTDLWWWKIPSSDLVMAARNEFSSVYLKHSKNNLGHVSTQDVNSLTGTVVDSNIAVWKGQTVSLRRLRLKQLTITKAVLVEFKQAHGPLIKQNETDVNLAQLICYQELLGRQNKEMLRDVNHSNLARIFGACFEDSLKALITECCIKGSLQDLLGNMNITMDVQFKSSLCRDIIDGLCYLHQSPIHQHGRLNSNVCLIDNRFSVKLTDFGLPTLYSNVLLDVNSDEFKNECKWKAPEILRSGATCTGTKEGDIYSYGMILLEIITQDSPFATETTCMTTDEIIQKVRDGSDPPFRPAMELPPTFSNWKEVMQSCCAENPKCRPPCRSVQSAIKRMSASLGDSGNLLDNLMRRMELYANNLEKMVEEKTAELREEKKKSEELLYQILPRTVADKLKAGLRVDPEVYDGVTIYFSDIVGFTEISAVSSPMEVVDLLNDIYSCFDAIIEEFDVYKVETIGDAYMVVSGLPQRNGKLHALNIAHMSIKVETIGDAYMVVSGLPQRNGKLHALNIAHMSIKVLETIREFKIRHMPTESVQIRIGLHSGSVCAGVVGSKMPRYCLFGDTVNTASRMESSGKAMMIHISPCTKALLDQLGSFHVLPRGNIEVKGKGQMFTYWLMTSHNVAVDLLVNQETSTVDSGDKITDVSIV